MHSNTLVYLEHWRQDYSLSTMATVVDLSKGNTYQAILFMWCKSCASCVFHGKTCTHDKLIRVVDVWCSTHTCACDKLIHVWLTVNLICTRDEFACVVHV